MNADVSHAGTAPKSLPLLVAFAAGTLSLALLLGALGFQYLGGYPPCEICHWQRWPHIASVLIGLGGWALLQAGSIERKWAAPIAWLALFCVALSGAIGVYHAGIEWHLWKGPQACTGPRFEYTGTIDFNARVVMCDIAAWRLFGISMAGYNAMISLGAALLGAFALVRHKA
ncbi:MAG TPA: disulfide bond formation protein B [Rhizomicrobium sp.]|nr:disulfide bond formation protein B [Rhizomicrobium sp.]